MQLNVFPFLALFLTIFLWASAFVGIRDALHAYSPVPLAVLRYLVASFILAGYAVLKKMDLPERKDLPGIFLLGLLGIAIYNIALNYGEQTVTAGAASLLVNTVPIFTALLAAAFLREQVNRRGWLGISLGFAGAAMITLGESRNIDFAFDWGVVLVLLAALVQAGYFVLQKFYLKRYSPLELTSYALWAGTLLMLPFSGGLWTEMRAAPLSSTLTVVYLGIFPAALAYVAYSYALSKMDASRATSFLYLVPVVTIPIGWIWLGEMPEMIAILGGTVALLGVAVVNRN